MAKRRNTNGGKGGNVNGVKYSKTVTKAVGNWRLNADLINSSEATKETRKEINRVFHAANRRLQNLANSGAYSPAANALLSYLSEDIVSGFNSFSKLTTSGKDWNEIKRDYAAAIEFLKKPTSTSSGAKQFENDVRQRLRLTPEQFNHIKTMIDENGGYNDYAAAKSLLPSDPTKVADFFRTAQNDIADEIENAAANLDGTNALKDAIATDLQNDINGGITAAFMPLYDSLESFDFDK